MRAALCLALVLVAACAGAPTTPAVSTRPSASVVAVTATPAVPPASAAPSATSALPIMRIALTDVRTGERFTLDGFPGKTVIVEGMAVW